MPLLLALCTFTFMAAWMAMNVPSDRPDTTQEDTRK
jgi:hypothetical protein